jgi:hypothetical protein
MTSVSFDAYLENLKCEILGKLFSKTIKNDLRKKKLNCTNPLLPGVQTITIQYLIQTGEAIFFCLKIVLIFLMEASHNTTDKKKVFLEASPKSNQVIK